MNLDGVHLCNISEMNINGEFTYLYIYAHYTNKHMYVYWAIPDLDVNLKRGDNIDFNCPCCMATDYSGAWHRAL